MSAVAASVQPAGRGPQVANRHHFKSRPYPSGSWYVGRPGPIAEDELARHPELGDLTVLGNPFHRRVHGERAIELYRQWLAAKILEGDKLVVPALRLLTPASTLVCSCVRKDGHGACHAKVIAGAARALASGGISPRKGAKP